jgi:hypothetical protein
MFCLYLLSLKQSVYVKRRTLISLYIAHTLAMFCLYSLPLARPAQAKIQMLTAISSIVKLIP